MPLFHFWWLHHSKPMSMKNFNSQSAFQGRFWRHLLSSTKKCKVVAPPFLIRSLLMRTSSDECTEWVPVDGGCHAKSLCTPWCYTRCRTRTDELFLTLWLIMKNVASKPPFIQKSASGLWQNQMVKGMGMNQLKWQRAIYNHQVWCNLRIAWALLFQLLKTLIEIC